MSLDINTEKSIVVTHVQGIGRRPEQQDSFVYSVAADYPEKGHTAIMCDGMGGMAAGGRISKMATEGLFDIMMGKAEPTARTSGKTLSASVRIAMEIRALSDKIYHQFYGRGGTTLVMTYIICGKLFFWCVGDSDLILVRGKRLMYLNERHEYRNELLRKAAFGLVTEERAFTDPQADALTEYIGKEDAFIEFNRRGFSLMPGDTLLLCSDGISDTLANEEMAEMLSDSDPEKAASMLESRILEIDYPTQDNYTGILIRYNGEAF